MTATNPTALPEALTARELEVLKLICSGRSNKMIADLLGLSIKTVEKHRDKLNQKLGSHSEIEMFIAALKRGLVTLEEIA